MTLKVSLLCTENHLLPILVWLELFDTADVIGRVFWKLHLHARIHELLLILLAEHTRLVALNYTAIQASIMTEGASYRIVHGRGRES